MADPTAPPGRASRSFEERLQARLALEASWPASVVPRRWSSASPPELPREDDPGDPTDGAALHQQIQVLRDQLEGAVLDLEERLDGAADRILGAELRATIADARTGDVLEALAKLERSLRMNPPATLEESTVRFRGVVDQLSERLNTSS